MKRALIALLWCAACAPSGTTGSQRAAILGGELDNGDPAVGMLEFSTGRFGTATLIAPNVVLTAAHVVGGNILAFYTGEGIPSPQLDNTVSSPTMVRHEIAQKQTHPAYGCDPAGTCDTLGGYDLDVGVVQLAVPIVDIVPYALDATVPSVGTTCRTVGFGIYLPEGKSDSDMATVKQKRQANVNVINVDDTYVQTEWLDGIADHGDSGGPLFCNQQLVATTTQHTDGETIDHRQEFDTRVDRGLPWIQSKIAEWSGADLAPPSDLAASDLSTTKPATTKSGCAIGATANGDVSLVGLVLIALYVRKRRLTLARSR